MHVQFTMYSTSGDPRYTHPWSCFLYFFSAVKANRMVMLIKEPHYMFKHIKAPHLCGSNLDVQTLPCLVPNIERLSTSAGPCLCSMNPSYCCVRTVPERCCTGGHGKFSRTSQILLAKHRLGMGQNNGILATHIFDAGIWECIGIDQQKLVSQVLIRFRGRDCRSWQG